MLRPQSASYGCGGMVAQSPTIQISFVDSTSDISVSSSMIGRLSFENVGGRRRMDAVVGDGIPYQSGAELFFVVEGGRLGAG